MLNVGIIRKLKYHTVSSDEILRHYSDNLINSDDSIKKRVLDYFVNKEIIIIILEGPDIIKKVRRLVGESDPSLSSKETIRGRFGIDSYKQADIENRSCRNIIHASDSQTTFEYEKSIWF